MDLQGLLTYLVCEGKDNYIIHLVLGREDESLSKSYESSSSTKIKQEPQIKKESKRLLLKKIKQKPKLKQEPKIKVCPTIFF
jgi:hypothetical protein